MAATNEPEPMRLQVLKLRGELNLEDMLKIKQLCEEYLRAGLVFVILDLEGVGHIHLAGLPQLVQTARKLREYGGDLKLAAVSPYLRHIIQLAGAALDLDQTEDMETAIKRFKKQGRRWVHNGGKHDQTA